MTEVNTNSDIKITLSQKFETNTMLIFCAHSVPVQWILILRKFWYVLGPYKKTQRVSIIS